ncbi:hypothetical protein COV24_02800 [candidate division WWE3 bacterium CG10_big_fil_rev_8_21_14_0_10_32_10]|uniref:Uncharacterized protein n=1 Tax=candidate division WWE3 bacterium CG10_big_fil_rev_8_21_14_0_10_32_10 TaxID=1975090 RepID=A0A2H0RC91_UNCKA|nr:MAG: hypothetical protein COV24_02800 [candidate division WWE3 bacterium CG10_big_fil_rev_8_21_14_0_10_32_10]
MKYTNEQAVQLGSRFALPPNSLGYCGHDSAPEKFKECVIKGNCSSIKDEFTKFIVLYPYLKTISKITNLPINSYEVIESYWLGNDLLKKANLKHYDLLLENFKKQGVPDFLIQDLMKNKPKKFIPHHLFQVLHVGVGKASGSVPFNLDSINNCMIRWGSVLKINKNSLEVNLNSLDIKNNKYFLVSKLESQEFINGFLPNLKIGDTVAVHWKQVIKILKKEEIKNLEYWTNEILNYIS